VTTFVSCECSDTAGSSRDIGYCRFFAGQLDIRAWPQSPWRPPPRPLNPRTLEIDQVVRLGAVSNDPSGLVIDHYNEPGIR